MNIYVKFWDYEGSFWGISLIPFYVWIFGRFLGIIAPSRVCDTDNERLYEAVTIPRSKIAFD